MAALRKDGVSPEVLSVIENAVGRGVIRSLDSYVKRVERFQRTGEYQITHLPPSERAPKKLVLVGPRPRPSSKRVTNKLSA